MRLAFAVLRWLLSAILLVSFATGIVDPVGPRVAQAAPRSAPPAAPEDIEVQAFLERQDGVLKSYKDGSYRAAQIIEGYSTYYNLDARILLTLLEVVPHLLTDPNPSAETLNRPFGAAGPAGFRAQIDWAAREVRAGFGPYTSPPEVRFSDGTATRISLAQDPSLVAVQRFLASGRTESEWSQAKASYDTIFRQVFGSEPATATPAATPSAQHGFLKLPWTPVYPVVEGDPLAGRPVRVVHSSYFDHVYPTVDRGPDGNDFIVTHENRGNVSYNSHDGHDYYFPDRPTGTPIVAAADGTAFAYTARGNGVVIRHGGAYAGYETVYWHLDAFDQRFAGAIDSGRGIRVQAGDYLGVSGKSGFVVGGAHLHFEVRHNGKQVDPYGWQGPGDDPCAVWTAGCEASVWLWDASLNGVFDFTEPEAGIRAPVDQEPPVGTLSVSGDSEIGLLVHFDQHPVQTTGTGGPTITGAVERELSYTDGVFDQALQLDPSLGLTYPISNNLDLRRGTLAMWVKLPEVYPTNTTDRHYLFAASQNADDGSGGVYTGTLALRRQIGNAGVEWDFWTVDDAGVSNSLVAADTLQPGWHHFAVAWDRGAASAVKKLFIDGRLAASTADASLPSFVGDRLELGRWTAGYGGSGVSADELVVLRKALSASDVQSLANRQDWRTGLAGPLSQNVAVSSRNVTLDTNAIDRQGGVVSVRLRRNDDAWGDPVPYYDSYRWTITGTEGLHTFAVEYRDRANNVAVVTTTVTLARPPLGAVDVRASTDVTGTVALSRIAGSDIREFQLSATPDFEDASWQPFVDEVEWEWRPPYPRVVYARFRSSTGLVGPTQLAGADVRSVFVPFVASANVD